MPLIAGKGPKAFSKNIKTEMKHGKPQKQAVAIAYSVKRKAQKKSHEKPEPKAMAEGGRIDRDDNPAEASAITESRPSPDKVYRSDKSAKHNSGDKAPLKGDDAKDGSDISYQAKKGLKTTPIKYPKMVKSDIVQARLRQEEDDLERSASPGPYGEQPPKHDDEEMAASHGDDVHDMEDEHSTHRKPYAKGGMIDEMNHPSKHDHEPKEDEIEAKERREQLDHMREDSPSMDEGYEHAMEDDEEGPNRQGPEVPDMEEEHSSGRKPYAKGGSVQFRDADRHRPEYTGDQPAYERHMYPHEMDDQPEEYEVGHAASIAAAIMAKRERMRDGADSGSEDMEDAMHDRDSHYPEEDHMYDQDGSPSHEIENGSYAYAKGGKVHSGSHDMDEAARYAMGGYAEGGEILDESDEHEILSHGSYDSDDSDMVDLSRNHDEDANEEDQMSYDALRKENYNSDYLDEDQPEDSNMKHDQSEEDEENQHDMDVVDRIRRNMMKRSPIARGGAGL